MSVMYHPSVDFAMGDPNKAPLSPLPSPEAARSFLNTMILSASGWRGVFGADDEDRSEYVPPERLYLAARMAEVFADRLLERAAASAGAAAAGTPAAVAPAAAGVSAIAAAPASGAAAHPPVVALGMDSRPTGPAIADAMLRVFLAKGLRVRYAFIIAAPEIMAWARRSGALPAGNPDRLDAFCYVSASHNPPGHNGVKFGYADGGVLPGDEAGALAARLRDGACEREDIARLAALCAAVPAGEVASAFAQAAQNKRKALSDYILFTRGVAGGSPELEEQERVLDELKAAVEAAEAGVVAEMNGSARSLSLDDDFLSGLGVRARLVNASPRAFAHRIVPEGESLVPCMEELARARRGDPGFCFGYVPDCDGDRGNIVVWDDAAGATRALEAQETFALASLAELAMSARARLTRPGRPGEFPPLAVAANDATSLRADYIAKAFGARVYRAETGEANVVGLARKLRAEGNELRIMGEGSNGGVITHPAAVRDPINTMTAVLKLAYLKGDEASPGPYRLWLRLTGREEAYSDAFSIADVVASLPPFTTTGAFEERAALRVRARNHAALKGAYEPLFKAGWPILAKELERSYGPVSWRALASKGLEERELAESFSASGTGGLKILVRDAGDNPVAFLWMRGSGTEAVFRVMVDVRGADPELEAFLLERHAGWVREADGILAR